LSPQSSPTPAKASAEQLLIRGSRIIDGPSEPQDVLITAGRIDRIGRWSGETEGIEILQADGLHLIPALVDLHLQGAGGSDVIDGNEDAIERIGATVGRFGVGGWLATTYYRPQGDNHHLRVASEAVGKGLNGPRVLGIHLEGPFVNPSRLGMLARDGVCEVDEYHLDRIFDLCGPALKMMTIAPELPGALEVIEKLVERGVVASFGHSNATYEQTQAGIAAGIRHVTHLFNAMRSIHHRDPGPVPAILKAKEVTAQIICDGAHVVPPVVWMIAQALGPQRLCVISDGCRILGSPGTEFIHDGRKVYSHDGILRAADGTLCGTSLGLSELTSRLAQFANWPIADAIKAASTTPRAVLGLGDAEHPPIRAGQNADLLLAKIDKNRVEVKMTMVDGKMIYRSKK